MLFTQFTRSTLYVLLLSVATAYIIEESLTPLGLNHLMQKRSKLYFGTATDPKYFNETRYIDIISNGREFGQITPENSLKFNAIQPQQGVFNYTLSDEIVNWAISKNYKLRCHTLIWYNALPEWLSSQTWDRPTLIAIMENHIKNVMMRYRGHCFAWDVVNEAVLEDGSYRSGLWYDTIGPEYINFAFKFAAKYDPKAKLYYNDYGIELVNNKSIGVAKVVQGLLKRGVKIDGVGLQAHFPVIQAPSYQQQMAALRQFTKLGVEVAFTELDVFVDMPNDAFKAAHQASIFADVVRSCGDTPNCVGVTVWGFYDPYSWVWLGVPGFGDANVWWANYTRKPAYYAMQDVLLGDRYRHSGHVASRVEGVQ